MNLDGKIQLAGEGCFPSRYCSLDELDDAHFHGVSQGAEREPEGSSRFSLGCPSVDDDQPFFKSCLCFAVLKCLLASDHTLLVALTSVPVHSIHYLSASAWGRLPP